MLQTVLFLLFSAYALEIISISLVLYHKHYSWKASSAEINLPLQRKICTLTQQPCTVAVMEGLIVYVIDSLTFTDIVMVAVRTSCWEQHLL